MIHYCCSICGVASDKTIKFGLYGYCPKHIDHKPQIEADGVVIAGKTITWLEIGQLLVGMALHLKDRNDIRLEAMLESFATSSVFVSAMEYHCRYGNSQTNGDSK